MREMWWLAEAMKGKARGRGRMKAWGHRKEWRQAEKGRHVTQRRGELLVKCARQAKGVAMVRVYGAAKACMVLHAVCVLVSLSARRLSRCEHEQTEEMQDKAWTPQCRYCLPACPDSACVCMQ